MHCRRHVTCGLAAAILSMSQAQAQTAPPLRPAPDDLATLPPVPEVVPKTGAQDADPYAPLGIEIGSFLVFPSVNLSTVYTSNVAKASKDGESDIGLRLRPAWRWESDWPRHSWTGQASGEWTWYEDRADFDSRQADVSSQYRLDIRRFTFMEFESSYNLDQTGIEDSEVPDTAIGNRTEHVLAASAALVHDFGPFEAKLRAGASWEIYEDVKLAGGGVEDNGDRNLVEPVLSLRGVYREPPVFKPFAELAYRPRIHQETLDRNGLRRDSQSWAARAGLVVDNAPFLTGETSLVYQVRDYEDDALETNDVLGFESRLTWSPTGLTSIVYTASTNLSETVSATSSGRRTWTLGAQLRHALRENVDLLAGTTTEFERADGGTDFTLDANLGLEWALNPSWLLTASYDGTWFDAAGNGSDYNEQRISIGMTLRR